MTKKLDFMYLVERKDKNGFIERIWVDDLKGGLKGWKVIEKKVVNCKESGLRY